MGLPKRSTFFFPIVRPTKEKKNKTKFCAKRLSELPLMSSVLQTQQTDFESVRRKRRCRCGALCRRRQQKSRHVTNPLSSAHSTESTFDGIRYTALRALCRALRRRHSGLPKPVFSHASGHTCKSPRSLHPLKSQPALLWDAPISLFFIFYFLFLFFPLGVVVVSHGRAAAAA